MKALLSMCLCMVLSAISSMEVSGQETEGSVPNRETEGWIDKGWFDLYIGYRNQPEEHERISLFSQSLETMARNLDPLERLSNELEVDGFEEMAQSAESFFKAAKPFVDRLEEAAKNRAAARMNAINESAIEAWKRGNYEKARSQLENEIKEKQEVPGSGTEKKSIKSPRLTGDPAVNEKVRLSIQESYQKHQQELMRKTAVEYYLRSLEAAQSEAKEEIGLFEQVVGNQAAARISGIEQRLTKLESMLEKVLSRLEDK